MKEFPQKLNFYMAGVLGVMGIALASEIIAEDDPLDKIDDVLFLLLGLFSIYWYRKNAHKLSITPIILTALGVVIKAFAVVVEFKDAEAVGDDFGILIPLVLILFVVIYQYFKIKKSLAKK